MIQLKACQKMLEKSVCKVDTIKCKRYVLICFEVVSCQSSLLTTLEVNMVNKVKARFFAFSLEIGD